MDINTQIKITSYESYASACRTYLPSMPLEDVNTKLLVRFVNDTNFRIIDWMQSGGKLNDSYILNMIKKSEQLFNRCLSEEDIKSFNLLHLPFDIDDLFKENLEIKHELERYKDMLEERGISID